MHLTRTAVLTAATLTVASLTGLAQVTATAAPAPTGHSSVDPTAHVWLTTPDGTHRLSDGGTVPFHHGGSPHLTLTVDPSLRYQRMDGFGASITDSSASVLSALAPAKRDAAMRSVFSRTQGIGMSFLRQPLGSSDFVDGPHYTFDDVPAGQKDYALRHFSAAHDQSQILPLLRQARALNPDVKVMLTPWSPPAWMKTGDSLVGGKLIDDSRVYAAYARYLVKSVQAYQAAGVPVWGLSIQNEPQNRQPNAYPGTDLTVGQAVQVIDRLGPDLQRAGLHTKILGYDHNWSEHPNDIASTPPGQDPETEYPAMLLRSSASRWLAGTAYHCYAGDQQRMTELHRQFPDKQIWFTECSGSHGAQDPPAQVFSDTLRWHARNITVGVPRNWAQSTENWNLALRPDGGPHNGGCDTCTGVLTVASDGTVTDDAEYYTLGHLSKFVPPGSVRVASSSFGNTAWNGMVTDVAFTRPDGSRVLVVHNEHDDPRTFAVAEGDRSFDYTLPGGALATFVWKPGPAGAGQLVAPWTTTMSSNASSADAPLAADDDASTAWRSGSAQAAGQWLQLDLGTRRHLRSLVLDAGPSSYGWQSPGTASTEGPAAWRAEVSADGTHWTTASTGTGGGQLTRVPLPAGAERYVRVVLTGAAAGQWQVAEVRAYS